MKTTEKIIDVYNKSGKYSFPRFASRIQFLLTLLITLPSWVYVVNSFPDSTTQQIILIRIGLLCYILALFLILGDLLKYIIYKKNIKKRDLVWSQCLEQKIFPKTKYKADEIEYLTFFTECITLLERANATTNKSERKMLLSQVELLGSNFDNKSIQPNED
ncbi:MAG: hypothetical protein ACRC26_08995 [Bacteroidales bacterium]